MFVGVAVAAPDTEEFEERDSDAARADTECDALALWAAADEAADTAAAAANVAAGELTWAAALSVNPTALIK